MSSWAAISLTGGQGGVADAPLGLVDDPFQPQGILGLLMTPGASGDDVLISPCAHRTSPRR